MIQNPVRLAHTLSRGLAFDSAGDLYASFVGGANLIYKFDASGAPSFVASGFDGPTFIAIQIPEPATWVLVALGAATLLGRRRLRPRCYTALGRTFCIRGDGGMSFVLS